MPSVTDHKDQFDHNLDFVTSFYVPGCRYLDWVINVYFYAAVHLVEAFPAIQGIHSGNHSERIRQIWENLRPVYNDYRRLYGASRRARYEVWKSTDTEVQRLISNHFEPLRNYVLGLV